MKSGTINNQSKSQNNLIVIFTCAIIFIFYIFLRYIYATYSLANIKLENHSFLIKLLCINYKPLCNALITIALTLLLNLFTTNLKVEGWVQEYLKLISIVFTITLWFIFFIYLIMIK